MCGISKRIVGKQSQLILAMSIIVSVAEGDSTLSMRIDWWSGRNEFGPYDVAVSLAESLGAVSGYFGKLYHVAPA